VSLVANRFIDELIHRARREGGVRDYYDIAVIGYSGDGVRFLVSPDGSFALPSRLAATRVPRARSSRERVLPSGRSVMAVVEHNVWIAEKASGTTPMCKALDRGLALVAGWCRQRHHAESYPPTVINITDGEASDGGAEAIVAIAEKIRRTGTSDGRTVLMNIDLCDSRQADGKGGGAVLFPSSPDELPDHRWARLLWDMSSEMPAACNDTILSVRPGATPPFRAMGWDSHIGGVAAMMNIGSINSVML
jgi:hypothetical protein